MTVSELIEALRALPGDPDLRMVIVDVTVQRPYAPDTRMHCRASRVTLERDVALVSAYGYIE